MIGSIDSDYYKRLAADRGEATNRMSKEIAALKEQIETLQSRNDELVEQLAIERLEVSQAKDSLATHLRTTEAGAELISALTAELERVRGMVPRWIPHSEAGLHAGDYWVALIGKPQAYTASFCNGRWTSDRCSLNPNTITHVMRIEAPALPPQPESQPDPGACKTCGGKGYTQGYTSGGRDSILAEFRCTGCPDCANQQAVVRCVCSLSGRPDKYPMCGAPFNQLPARDINFCGNFTKNNRECGHHSDCHQQPSGVER